MSLTFAQAHPIQVTTTCGEIVWLDSDNYDNAQEFLTDVIHIDSPLCDPEKSEPQEWDGYN